MAFSNWGQGPWESLENALHNIDDTINNNNNK